MIFWQYLTESKITDVDGLSEALAERLAELMARGHSVADLVSHYGDELGHLPVERLRGLAQAHRAWQSWRRHQHKLEKLRQQGQHRPLPAAAWALTTSPDELDALARSARLWDSGAADLPAEDTAWTAHLRAGVELWRACMRLARQQTIVACTAAPERSDQPTAAAPAAYDSFLRTKDAVGEIPAHRWLALRRGVREGVLSLTLTLPVEALEQQLPLYLPRLGPVVEGREPSSVMDELVRDDLESSLLSVLDTEAQEQAIRSASESLAGLLRTPPLTARRVGAVWIGRSSAAIAAIVADREGELSAQRVLKPEGAWLDKVVELLSEHRAHVVVLPASGAAPELLSALETALSASGTQLERVRTAALAEAREVLTKPPLRLGPTAASALVLARRALDPLKEWSAVDPVHIGVAEYQHDLDADRLRAALTETAELCRLERRRGKTSPLGASAPRGSAAVARLNPLVHSLADLRPGMTVHGVVTNISHFGAFISIGLGQDGLVHISELSDDFVANPNEVVSLGQQVTARVLAVDRARGRISLTMRSAGRSAQAQSSGDRARGGAAGSAAPPRPRSKAEALAHLERLFRK